MCETNKYSVLAAACWFLCACGKPSTGNPPAGEASLQTQPDLVAKVWISTDASAARGTMRIFLPGGTLVLDSCYETYRLALWQAVGDRHVEWQEDTARIEAEITELTDQRLQLRLRLAEGFKEETYRLAQVPFVCPDMPR